MSKCKTCNGSGSVSVIGGEALAPCDDCEGTGEVCSAQSGDWGHLPNEPCRFCHKQGKVYFQIDDGPEGRRGLQASRCDNCGRSWTVDSANA